MNNYIHVEEMLDNWTRIGMSKAEIVVQLCEACLEWPYVFGAWGEVCTPSKRGARASAAHPTIVSKCQVLNHKKNTCDGCKWGIGVRMFDCRGFTYWIFLQIGIQIEGQGATSQWNTKKNWSRQGPISEMPLDQVCCVFKQDGKSMKHTGVYIGGGAIIHCSSGVERGKVTDKGWTHYAIPAGMEGVVPVVITKETIKKGSKGPLVTEMQNKLLSLGYDIGPDGADGVFGSKTLAGLKAFQKDHNLKQDGVCGQNTWTELDKETDPDAPTFTVTYAHISGALARKICAEYPGAVMTQD